jgi:hypothetical protein
MKTVKSTAEITSGVFQVNASRKLMLSVIQAKNQLIEFVKFVYLVAVLVLLVVAVIELKHIYNVDIFPGVDTPFDNIYYAGKENFGKGILKIFGNLLNI